MKGSDFDFDGMHYECSKITLNCDDALHIDSNDFENPSTMKTDKRAAWSYSLLAPCLFGGNKSKLIALEVRIFRSFFVKFKRTCNKISNYEKRKYYH